MLSGNVPLLYFMFVQDMCLPSLTHLLQLTSDVFNHVTAKHLFIATDKNPYTEEFRNLLQPRGVSKLRLWVLAR